MRKWRILLLILIPAIIAVVFFILMERVTIEINLQLPVDKLPIYRGYSDPLVETWIVFSPMDYRNYSDRGLCFLVEDNIVKNFTRSYNGLEFTGEFIDVTGDPSIISNRIKDGEFQVLGPGNDLQYPMSGLGSVRIFNYTIIYYDETTYSFKNGEGVYLPAYILYAESSNYGDVRILVWATKELI